jgi:hypothetical protein
MTITQARVKTLLCPKAFLHNLNIFYYDFFSSWDKEKVGIRCNVKILKYFIEKLFVININI